MRGAVVVLVALAAAGCGRGGNQLIPAGQYAGSTAADRAFQLDVAEEPKVNQHKARFIDRGVIEYKDAGAVTRLTCKKLDRKGEELRCTLRTTPPGGGSPTTEVIDLMLL
jgi:hypothetical protein